MIFLLKISNLRGKRQVHISIMLIQLVTYGTHGYIMHIDHIRMTTVSKGKLDI